MDWVQHTFINLASILGLIIVVIFLIVIVILVIDTVVDIARFYFNKEDSDELR